MVLKGDPEGFVQGVVYINSLSIDDNQGHKKEVDTRNNLCNPPISHKKKGGCDSTKRQTWCLFFNPQTFPEGTFKGGKQSSYTVGLVIVVKKAHLFRHVLRGRFGR